MKHLAQIARRAAALVLAAVLVCTLVPAAFAEEEIAHPTTIGGADTTRPGGRGKLPELALRLQR